MAKAKPRAAKPKGTWGGARPGAGRKKKAVEEAQHGAEDAPLVLGDAKGHSEITEYARQMSLIALEALGRVARSSKSRPADIIKASVEILTWGYGKPQGILVPPARTPNAGDAPDTDEPAKGAAKQGKKELAQQAAENPDTTTPMGRMLAKRAGLKVVE